MACIGFSMPEQSLDSVSCIRGFDKLRIIAQKLKIIRFFRNDRKQGCQGILRDISGEIDKKHVLPIMVDQRPRFDLAQIQ